VGAPETRQQGADVFRLRRPLLQDRGDPAARGTHLPWRKYQTIVAVEFYRVRCPKCGLKVEKVPQLPSKAPFS
jgi:hypothetical protein